MIELNWTEATTGSQFIFLIMYFTLVLLYYGKCVTYPFGKTTHINKFLWFFSLCLIIFVSASSNSDWYNYQHLVWNYDFSLAAYSHGEPIYGLIIKFVNHNYFLFRIIVWGSAFILTTLSFQRMNVNVNVAIFMLMAVFLLKFNYARATLSMSCYFLGLSYLLVPSKNRKVLSFATVVLLFLGAYSFHHSILPVILLTITMFFPFDKPFVTLSLLLILPILAIFLFSHFGLLENYIGEQSYSRLDNYIDKESQSANIYGIIANIIKYGSFVIPIVANSAIIYKNKDAVSIPMMRLYRVTISIVMFSMMFLFMQLSSNVFAYRYLFMTFIPLTIISVYLYQNGFMNRKCFSIILLWGIIANTYDLLVGLYKTF